MGLADWRKLTDQIESLEAETRIQRDEAAQSAALADRGEQQAVEIDARIAEVDTLIRTSEVRMAQNRERIVALEAAIDSECTRIGEFAEQTARLRRQGTAMRGRAGDLDQNLAAAQAAITETESRRRELSGRLADEERAFTALPRRWTRFEPRMSSDALPSWKVCGAEPPWPTKSSRSTRSSPVRRAAARLLVSAG